MFRRGEETDVVLSVKEQDETFAKAHIQLEESLGKAETAVNLFLREQNVPTAAKKHILEQLKHMINLVEQL